MDRQAFELRAPAGTRGAGAPLRNRSGASSAIILSLSSGKWLQRPTPHAGSAADAADAATSPGGAARGQQGLPESPPAPAGATGQDGTAWVAEAAREMEVRPPPGQRFGAVGRDAVGRAAGRRDNTSLIEEVSSIEEVTCPVSTG